MDSFLVDVPEQKMRDLSNNPNYSFSLIEIDEGYKMTKHQHQPKSYNEKQFVFNFLQEEGEGEAAAEEDDTAADAKLKEDLMNAELAHFYAKESKQRIQLFMLMDDDGKGWIPFNQFYDLIKYATMFNNMASHSIYNSRLYVSDIRARQGLVKPMATEEDQNNINGWHKA
jgi:hypothetical protein